MTEPQSISDQKDLLVQIEEAEKEAEHKIKMTKQNKDKELNEKRSKLEDYYKKEIEASREEANGRVLSSKDEAMAIYRQEMERIKAKVDDLKKQSQNRYGSVAKDIVAEFLAQVA